MYITKIVKQVAFYWYRTKYD